MLVLVGLFCFYPMKEQLNLLSIESREDEAIRFLKEHEPKADDPPYLLLTSGGKDSSVLYYLTKKSGVRYLPLFNATGLEPPEMYRFVKQTYPDINIVRPYYKGHRSFFGMMQLNGYPWANNRWCCDLLKKQPSMTGKYAQYEHRLVGIRAEERVSRARRGRINYLKKGIRSTHKYVNYAPLFYWLEWEIWDYIDANKIPYSSLYDEGHGRTGCVVCPFITGEKQLNMHKEKWPKHYYAFEKAMFKLWTAKKKAIANMLGYELSFEQYLDCWYKKKRFPEKSQLFEDN